MLESADSAGQYGFQNFNSPAEPLGNGRWRIWHGTWSPALNIGVAEGVPGVKMEQHFATLSAGEPAEAPLSVGNLPDGWRPYQPVHLKLKSGRHRLYFWIYSRNDRVARYLAAESDDGRRYRVLDVHHPVLYHYFHDRAVEFNGSDTEQRLKLAGLSAEARKSIPRPGGEPVAPPELVTNDGAVVYQLEDGTFEMYLNSVVPLEKGSPRWAANDNIAGYVRVIDRLVSKDGLKFYDRRTVIDRDPELDPIDQQFYQLNVTRTAKGRVGMLAHYRLKDQTMDLEWCFSKDGLHWTRPFRQRGWLERGWPGEPDSLAIYTGASLAYDEGKWWLFYTGCNYTHNRKHQYGDPRSVIMLATTPSIWR